jgi:hypothetical protein
MKKLCSSSPVLIDVKALHKKEDAVKAGFNYWSL